MVQDQEGTAATPAAAETKMETSPVKASSAPPAVQPEPSSSSSSTTVTAGSTSVSPGDEQDKLSRALNAFVQGKRHFLMKDTAHACAALSDACRLLTEIHGPIASEHAEAHFFYGRTLLDLARAELAVFETPAAGDKSEGDEETEESDEEEGDRDEDGDEEEEEEEEEPASAVAAASSSSSDVDKAEKSKEANGETRKTETEGTASEEDINVPSPAPGPVNPTEPDDEKPSTSSGAKGPEVAEPEDLSNLELAWEVLEIAKLGFKKQIETLEANLSGGGEPKTADDPESHENILKQAKRRLAETHTVLGEVSTESESYGQAVEDFKTALNMYADLESPDSREIAQIHFHIGVAHGLAKEFQASVASFNQSVEIIRQRVENLKTSLANVGTEDASASQKKEELEKEIQELTELLPELEERINDTLEQEKDAAKAEAEEKMEEEIIQRNSPVKNPNPPAANDISHLVKKRKKVEEPVVEAEPPAKKACTNLSFETSAAPVNGHAKKDEKDGTTAAADIPEEAAAPASTQ